MHVIVCGAQWPTLLKTPPIADLGSSGEIYESILTLCNLLSSNHYTELEEDLLDLFFTWMETLTLGFRTREIGATRLDQCFATVVSFCFSITIDWVAKLQIYCSVSLSSCSISCHLRGHSLSLVCKLNMRANIKSITPGKIKLYFHIKPPFTST